MSFDLRFVSRRFLGRLHYFLLMTGVVSAIGITVAAVLPPIYEAEARLLVEAPQIPDDLAPTTVRSAAPEILQIIKERLTTRDKMLNLAARTGVYEGTDVTDPDKIVLDMRKRLTMRLPNSGDLAAVVMVSFAAPNGEMSARVSNALVAAIVEESVALRTASAAQTLDFFTAEVARLNEVLSEQGAKILQFKLANKDALPESLDYRRTRQTTLQEQVQQFDRAKAGLTDRRARLVELFERTGQVEQVTEARTPEERQLQDLQDELSKALAIYSVQNPKVVTLQAQVKALQQAVSAKATGVTNAADGPTVYELQLSDIDGQAAFIDEQKAQVEAELTSLQASIDATPQNAIQLDVLQRDYDNIQLQYNTAVAGLSQAATGDRIESLSKGQRITVIEEASVPKKATSPNRKLIAAGSVLAGLGLGAALVFLMEVMDKSIRRPVDLESALGITPFAAIPYIDSNYQIRRRRLMIGGAVLLVAVGVPLGLYLTDQYVTPLDRLLQPVLGKLGLAQLVLPFVTKA
jgi:polysaccharide biosynthesis transport protein